jgi:hypothetical protein
VALPLNQKDADRAGKSTRIALCADKAAVQHCLTFEKTLENVKLA